MVLVEEAAAHFNSKIHTTFMKPKTLLYLLVAIAIIAVVAFVVYQFISSGNSSNAPAGVGQTGALPNTQNQHFPTANQPLSVNVNTNAAFGTSASSSKFGIISNDPALDYFIDAANVVTLVKPDGTIESIANSKTSVISTTTVSNIINAAFSYDGKKMFITARNGTTTRSSVFNLASKSWVRLPDGMQSSVWSPMNYQIAYLAPSNSGTETITTIDLGTANTKPVAVMSLAMEDMSLQWPSKNIMVISDRPSAFTTGSIWLFNISSKMISSAAYENFGSESLWSASSSAIIFSAGSNNAGGQLVFQNIAGAQRTLSFVTLPSKCAFGTPLVASGTMNPSSPIYCAVPSDQNTLSSARLPDEYDQKIYFSDDDFYSINTGTGLLNRIFSASAANQTIDATDLKVFNNILFFINRYDQKVYAIAL